MNLLSFLKKDSRVGQYIMGGGGGEGSILQQFSDARVKILYGSKNNSQKVSGKAGKGFC